MPVDNGLPIFEVAAKVLFPSVKSKASITFILDPDTYSRWPLSIGLLKCDAKVAYGRAEYVLTSLLIFLLSQLLSALSRSLMRYRVG